MVISNGGHGISRVAYSFSKRNRRIPDDQGFDALRSRVVKKEEKKQKFINEQQSEVDLAMEIAP